MYKKGIEGFPYYLGIASLADVAKAANLIDRAEESSFEFLEMGRSYAFDADGGLLGGRALATESLRSIIN
jgi:hypothetical protein